MRWASSLSSKPDGAAALAEALAGLGAPIAPDLLILFATSHHTPRLRQLLSLLSQKYPEARRFGCTVSGGIGGGLEQEHGPVLALVCANLPDVAINLFHVSQDQLDDGHLGLSSARARFGVQPDQDPAFVLLTDPSTLRAELLNLHLDTLYPKAVKVGGLASGASSPGQNRLILDDELHEEGAVGMALVGDVVMDAVVAQGARPVGPELRVTRCDDNIVLSLNDEPPLPLLERVLAELPPKDRNLFLRAALVGLSIGGESSATDYLVRNVLGADRARGAIAVGASLEEGQILRLHVRDADTARDDLRGALNRYRKLPSSTTAAGALLFSCAGRGARLFGHPAHDSQLFASMVPDAPVGGFFCAGEIGPVHGRTWMHGFTSSFGIFRAKGWD